MKIHQSIWIHWPFFSKTWTKGYWPQDDLWPLSLLRSHVWLYPRIIVSKSHKNTLKYVDTDPFFKNLNQRSLTSRWPLNPCLLRSHAWLFPRIIVSKSNGNASMYVYTVINFTKLPHTIHTYYIQNEWSHSLLLNTVQVRQLLNTVQVRQKETLLKGMFWLIPVQG